MSDIDQVWTALERVAAEIGPTIGYAEFHGLKREGRGAGFFEQMDIVLDVTHDGLRTDGPEAADSLRKIVEVLPSLYDEAEKAGLKPDFGGSAVHIKLDMIRGYANEGLKDVGNELPSPAGRWAAL